MVFRTIGDQNLDSVVNVRLTSGEKVQLQEDAEMAGVSVSALVRARYFGRRLTANSDRVMLAELRRLGGLLKHLHNESNGDYSHHTADALMQIQRYIKSLNSKMLGKDEPK